MSVCVCVCVCVFVSVCSAGMHNIWYQHKQHMNEPMPLQMLRNTGS